MIVYQIFVINTFGTMYFKYNSELFVLMLDNCDILCWIGFQKYSLALGFLFKFLKFGVIRLNIINSFWKFKTSYKIIDNLVEVQKLERLKIKYSQTQRQTQTERSYIFGPYFCIVNQIIINIIVDPKFKMAQLAKNHDVLLLAKEFPTKKQQDFYNNQKCSKKDFSYIEGPQSHSLRRKLILDAHPEVKNLMKPTSYISYYLAVIVVAAQITIAYLVRDAHWLIWLATLYIVGGTLSHTCHVLVHDFTHYAGPASIFTNKIFATFCNFSIAFPTAHSFGKYHADHHNFLNEQGKDPDLPFRIEANTMNTRITKLIFLVGIAVVYAFRPMLFHLKPLTLVQIVNIVVIIIYDALVYYTMGGWTLAYLLGCVFLSIGPHPAAMHILAEHFEYLYHLQTYDYLGWWNIPNLNIGYHIQHHDFPTMPWYNLPKLRKAAPEFYEQFPKHTDYFAIMKKFVMDDNFGLYHRTIRNPKD